MSTALERPGASCRLRLAPAVLRLKQCPGTSTAAAGYTPHAYHHEPRLDPPPIVARQPGPRLDLDRGSTRRQRLLRGLSASAAPPGKDGVGLAPDGP